MTIKTYGCRLLALTAAVILLLGILGSMLAADVLADGGVSVSVESAEAGAGDSVTVYVTISGNPGICNFDLAVTYDDGLELTGISKSGALCAKGFFVSNIETGYIVWVNTSDVTTAEGNLFSLTFTVDQEAKQGDYNISIGIKEGGAFGGESGAIAAEFTGGKITVVGTSGQAPDEGVSGPEPQTGSTGTGNGSGQGQGAGAGSTDGQQTDGGNGTPVVEAIAFSDVSPDAWYYNCVQSMAAAGVVKGYPDNTFKPSANVTYAEALKLILLASGYDLEDSAEGHWAENYLNFAVKTGLVGGDAELDEPIARIDIAHIVAGANGIAEDDGAPPFNDTNDRLVTALYNIGLIKGYETGDFGPERPVSRAEITMIVWRLYSYVNTGSIQE